MNPLLSRLQPYPFERRSAVMGIVMSAFSMATVAGVPASLWLASLLGWHAPFVAIAGVSALVWLGADPDAAAGGGVAGRWTD